MPIVETYIVAASIVSVLAGVFVTLLLAITLYRKFVKRTWYLMAMLGSVIVYIFVFILFLPDIFDSIFGYGFDILYKDLRSDVVIWVILGFLIGALFSSVLFVLGRFRVIRIERSKDRLDLFVDEE